MVREKKRRGPGPPERGPGPVPGKKSPGPGQPWLYFTK